MAVIPREVVVVTVVAAFAVGFVVLVVVRDQVVQRKAIVRRDEVDAGPRLATASIEDIAGARHARRQVANHAAIALPKCTRGVAKSIVPLGPARRKITDLITAGPDVPRFGD